MVRSSFYGGVGPKKTLTSAIRHCNPNRRFLPKADGSGSGSSSALAASSAGATVEGGTVKGSLLLARDDEEDGSDPGNRGREAHAMSAIRVQSLMAVVRWSSGAIVWTYPMLSATMPLIDK